MICCPNCKEILIKDQTTYRCINNHCFDISKQGYTNLFLRSSQNSGDSKEMVEARTTFLNHHYYDFLVKELISIIGTINPSTIVDAGCGEGYYTNLITRNTNAKVFAFDVSKEALKYASKRNKNINYFLASIFNLPIVEESIEMVLNVFSPLANEEYLRILKIGGYLIKVDPNYDHLKEMKDYLYDDVYENETLNLKMEGFKLVDYREIKEIMKLDNSSLCSLFKMTPYYYRTKKEKALKLMELETMQCRASFILYLYQKL